MLRVGNALARVLMRANAFDQQFGQMNLPLFRKEVLQARRTSWLGGISLVQPLRTWLFVTVAGIAAISVVIFLCEGTYTHRSSVSGQLVPTRGLATVMAPATGVLTRLDVTEGQRVAAGKILGVVTVPRATLASGDTGAALQRQLRQRGEGLKSAEQAQLQQLEAQEQGLRAQLTNLRQDWSRLTARWRYAGARSP
ncbi:putative membrane fusion transmembrane protein (fragment) [Xanthomonas citri pv. fuscans]